MSMLLVIAFTSAISTEEYVVDHNLTRSDCIERMQEERKFIMSMPVEEAYAEYMNSFKAEHMDSFNGKTPVVDWEINCVKG